MVDYGKNKKILTRLFFAFKSKKSTDIVSYAEKIIDDYTGLSALRSHRLQRRKKRLARIYIPLFSVSFLIFLCLIFKIFF